MTDSSPTRHLRASDDDRSRIHAEISNAYATQQITLDDYQSLSAQVWQARYLDELERLVPDSALPAPAQPTGWPTIQDSFGEASRNPPLSRQAEPTARRIAVSVSIFGGSDQVGRWVVPARHTGIAIMGGHTIDLRDARFQGLDVTINCFAVMGGISVIVPPDMDVEVSGVGFMGGFGWSKPNEAIATAPPVAGTPTIRIKGLALMGGVDVRRLPSTASAY